VRLRPPNSLAQLIERPNPRTNRHRFVRGLVEDLAIFDDAYAVILANEANGKKRIFRIPPQFIRPYNDPQDGTSSWLFADVYELYGSAGRVVIPQEQVIHIHGHNPEDARRGLSPLEALRRILAEEASSGEWREQYWQNAARMSGVVERPVGMKWSKDARERFADGWIDAYRGTGGKAGRTPVLEDGMHFVPATFSPQESEYLSARKLSREEVAAQYFIPPAFVGILDNANFSNMDEQHISLYADTLGPWLDDIEEDLELQLFPALDDVDPETDYLEFDLEQKLKGSFEKQAAAISTAVGAPWLLRNEQRARANLPAIEGGDELVTPLNVLVGGLASPRDTAPPPALALAAASRAVARKTYATSTTREVRKWDVQHRAVVEDFFLRQSRSVMAGLGAGKTVGEAFDSVRWNTELAADLLPPSVAQNEDLGQHAAARFGADYDASRAAAWLGRNTEIAATMINAATLRALGVAVAGAKARRAGRKYSAADLADELGAEPYELDFDDLSDEELDTGLPDPLDGARGVFALAVAARAAQIAISRSTNIGNFSLRDGAQQAGARGKVWLVVSANSRHPEMDGETVPIGEDFSIGGAWPGDSALDVSETAGCDCVLDFVATLD
jgi:HK97 family phage portal protein